MFSKWRSGWEAIQTLIIRLYLTFIVMETNKFLKDIAPCPVFDSFALPVYFTTHSYLGDSLITRRKMPERRGTCARPAGRTVGLKADDFF